MLRHPELDRLTIAHVDCDAFYAAIEKRDNPALADKAVIVGGGRRGVVTTACYLARTRGVRSAMPMFEARRLCPQAVVIPPDMAKYARVGREVRRLMTELTPAVEPVSIDEAFMDLTGTERLHGATAAKLLARFAARVEREIGITVSVGLSTNKFLAKIASDLDKPRGFAVLGASEARPFLAPKPVSFIWGVGGVTAARLTQDGFAKVGDLAAAAEIDLMRRYGNEGRRLWRLARGIDERRVTPNRETKSISAETTFDEDVADAKTLKRLLWILTEKVSARLKAAGLSGRTITLKLKTADFRLKTRAASLHDATQLASRIFKLGRHLLDREIDGTRYRLIGIGVSELSDAAKADPPDLLDESAAAGAAAERAVDRLRAKFGPAAIVKGLALEAKEDG